jgi:signal transduction histidine kinase
LSDQAQQSRLTSTVARKAVVSRNVQYGQTLRYQIWRSDGHLAFQSANAPDAPMTDLLGFSESRDPQGAVWRHYSIWNRSHELRAVVSEANDLRTQLVRSIAIRSIDPIVLGMPVFILLLWLSVRSGLVPLTKLGLEIAIRKPGSLALLDESSTQRELRPIVSALNDLLRRIEHALENQRLFNANAAHELGTPLAAIQAHLYVARNAEDHKERQLALDQAQLGVERGIRLVSQMLTLSRLEPQQALPDMAHINLGQIAQNVCAELAPLALQRSQNLELVAAPEPMFLDGNADLLHRLIGNLVDNAIRYTPPGGHISVQVCQVATGLRLTVNDDGPGIPVDQRDQVFNRFYRLADQSSNGSGLGLAICRSIANLHHAQISLSQGPNGKGLAACVDFATAVE